MTATRSERFEAMRDKVREALLVAAERLFAERGFEAVTVRQLAAEAGISLGLLYNYYNGKEDVLKALMHKGLEAILHTLPVPADHLPPARRIEAHIRQSFAMLRTQAPFWKLIHRLRMQPAALADLAPDLPLIASQLHQAVQAHLQQAGVPEPNKEAHLLIAAIDGITAHYLMHGDDAYLDTMTDYLVRRFAPPSS